MQRVSTWSHQFTFNFILCNCVRIEEALSSCSASTGDIISTTERLQQELEVITQRQEIVSCFLQDYQLSNEEVLPHTLTKSVVSMILWLPLCDIILILWHGYLEYVH
jgi:hypothetical protein